MIGTSQFRVRKAILCAALCAGAMAAGVARADDSSLNPFTGESYAAFSGGYNRPAVSNPSVDRAPSAWRQANPGGISERVLESYSAPGEAWHINAPTYASSSAVATFKQTHPNGLEERELQALSSEGAAWQMRATPGTATLAAEDATALAQAPGEPLRSRIGSLFHRASSTQ
jgi:hypothetical protein